MLLATMRVTPCGEEGVRRDFSRVAPQALRVARARLRARAVAASALATGNKKSAVMPSPPLLWEMADCAFCRQRKSAYQYQRPSIVNSLLRAESDMTAQGLAYFLSVDIVKIFLCHLLECVSDKISIM